MSDSDDVVELLPCPFCGKQPTTQDYRSSSDETGEVYGYAGVECHHGKAEGGAVFHFDTLAEAVTAWNTRAALSATPLAQGYIVGNGDRTKWRAWRDGLPVWVDDPVEATRYSFRSDANAAHAEDEDAWCIVEYKDVATPSARITGDKGGENPAEGAPLATAADELVKHMTERFLQWKLPADFNPDGGVIFDPVGSVGTAHEYRREPVGTNLLTYTQAEAMVRHMLNGFTALRAERGDGWRMMDSAPRGWDDVLVFSPEHEGFNNGGVFSAFYDPDRRGWFTHWVGENMRLNPTHWRPLPPPPAALKQEGQSDD